jgi:hypothetical protein
MNVSRLALAAFTAAIVVVPGALCAAVLLARLFS